MSIPIAVGDHVYLDEYVKAVPDHADVRVPVGGGPSCLWEVVDVQAEATLIHAYPERGAVFAVTGEDRAKLKLVHGGTVEAKAILDARSAEGRLMREAQDYDEIRDEVLHAQARRAEVERRGIEGASAVEMVGKLDANIAAEQARDRELREVR